MKDGQGRIVMVATGTYLNIAKVSLFSLLHDVGLNYSERTSVEEAHGGIFKGGFFPFIIP